MIELLINIPEYNPNVGFKHLWEDGFEITTKIENNTLVLSANRAGLISLAKQLLTLAQTNVPEGCHFHLDEYNSLEKGSVEIIIGKI